VENEQELKEEEEDEQAAAGGGSWGKSRKTRGSHEIQMSVSNSRIITILHFQNLHFFWYLKSAFLLI